MALLLSFYYLCNKLHISIFRQKYSILRKISFTSDLYLSFLWLFFNSFVCYIYALLLCLHCNNFQEVTVSSFHILFNTTVSYFTKSKPSFICFLLTCLQLVGSFYPYTLTKSFLDRFISNVSKFLSFFQWACFYYSWYMFHM